MMNEMSFQLISNIFSDFSLEGDRRTDGRTDRASYRGAMAHLKRDREGEIEIEFISFTLRECFDLKDAHPRADFC